MFNIPSRLFLGWPGCPCTSILSHELTNSPTLDRRINDWNFTKDEWYREFACCLCWSSIWTSREPGPVLRCDGWDSRLFSSWVYSYAFCECKLLFPTSHIRVLEVIGAVPTHDHFSAAPMANDTNLPAQKPNVEGVGSNFAPGMEVFLECLGY